MITLASIARQISASSRTSFPAFRTASPHRGAPHLRKVSRSDRLSPVHLPGSLFSRPHRVYLASISEQEDPRSCPSKVPSWGERRSSRDTDAPSIDTSKWRYADVPTAALTLSDAAVYRLYAPSLHTLTRKCSFYFFKCIIRKSHEKCII